MSAIDTDALLKEISPDAPSGEDLEYDPAFTEMERAGEGKPEQEVGDTKVPAEEPDWREVKGKALDVLGRSHDLRAGVYLARAALRTDGFAGFADGLALIRKMIETYWDTLHPQLDPDDDNDPTMRVNAIEALADLAATLKGIREAPLVSSRVLGRYGIRELEFADGTVPLPPDFEGDPPSTAAVEAAFMDADLDEIIATADAITAAIDSIAGIDSRLAECMDVTATPDLKPLGDMLKVARQAMTGPMARRGIGGDADAEGEGAEDGGAGGGAQRIAGEITNREDVVRTLEKICEYYQRSEPASPVPLLLRRAQRVATMTFMEIVRDLTPSGVSEAEWFRGAEEEQ